MHNVLRQSTASQQRIVGPFVDDTDFKTAETALTIVNTDIKLMKNGAASVNKNSGGGTHRVNGDYAVTWDATDTDTVGELEVSILVTGALVVKRTYQILDEDAYDALYASNATILDNDDVGLSYKADPNSVTDQTTFVMPTNFVTANLLLQQTVLIYKKSTDERFVTWVAAVNQTTDTIVTAEAPPFTLTTGATTDVTIRVYAQQHPRAAINNYAPAEASVLSLLTTDVRGFFRLLFRKDAAVITDQVDQLTIINNDDGSGAGASNPATDSVEAIADRLPAALTVGGRMKSAVQVVNGRLIVGTGTPVTDEWRDGGAET